jgi:hypothetical protein
MDVGSTSVGRLTEDQVRSVLGAAARAPSLHNTQPWRFHCDRSAIELRADYTRTLPATDPDGHELLLACGAALLNLRLAIRAYGVIPEVSVLPSATEPELLAVVHPRRSRAAGPDDQRLASAIARRRTHREPFTSTPVPVSVRNELRRAAEAENAWLVTLHGAQLPALRSLVHGAHQAQLRDPDFLAEWRQWIGRENGSPDGVLCRSAGPRPESQDVWVLRDFAAGRAPLRLPGVEFEPEPLLVVVGSFQDTTATWLSAGQAMQRVLLTATTAGVAGSFLSQVVEVGRSRARLRTLVGGRLWPQAVLRLGYASMLPPPTPRRPVEEIVRYVESCYH